MANQEQREGGGIRPPEYMVQMALDRIEDLMIQAVPWKRIRAILYDEGYTESESTAKRWRQLVLERWRAEDAELRPALKFMWRSRLEAQYEHVIERAAGTKSDAAYALLMAEATRIAKVAIVMDGLAQPVLGGTPDQLPAVALSPLEREREIQALMARRDAARRAGGGGN